MNLQFGPVFVHACPTELGVPAVVVQPTPLQAGRVAAQELTVGQTGPVFVHTVPQLSLVPVVVAPQAGAAAVQA